MSVRIRLRRMGAKNRPYYRVVAADSRTANQGRFLENLGWYDPRVQENDAEIKLERVDYWVQNGATMTDTVKTLVEKCRTQG